MLKLIRKDLKLNFSNKESLLLTLLFIPFIMLLLDFSVNEQAIAVMIFATNYVLTITPFGYEEKSKPLILIQSLPITKKETVISKYIIIFINYILVIVYTYIYLWIISFFGNRNLDSFNISIIRLTLPIVILFVSTILPAYFRLVPRFANAVGVGVFIFTSNTFLTFNFEKTSMKILDNSNPLLIPLIAVIVYFISMGVSIALYENRELY